MFSAAEGGEEPFVAGVRDDHGGGENTVVRWDELDSAIRNWQNGEL